MLWSLGQDINTSSRTRGKVYVTKSLTIIVQGRLTWCVGTLGLSLVDIRVCVSVELADALFRSSSKA